MLADVSPRPENLSLSPAFNLLKFVPTIVVPLLVAVMPVATFTEKFKLNRISLFAVADNVPVYGRESLPGAETENEPDVIVTGGRGIGGTEGFKQLEELADIFHGAIGASRPACDNQWVPDNIQIGLTGKIVSPDLYIAVAVSGSSQHLSGCSGSKVIIAINKDPDANIFEAAHYGIVADWKKVLPAFTKRVKELVLDS